MKKFLCLLTLSIFLLPAPVRGEGRLVKVIVPLAAGGGVDVIARIYARKIGEMLKESWIIENLSGASGTIGASSVARAAPDGTTLLFVPDAHFMVRLVVKNVPYDPFTDFTPIARVAASPLVFAVNPARVQARNLAELAADVKANPKHFSFGISGLGSSGRIGAEIFRTRTGIDVLLVPYRGVGPEITDLVAGQITMAIAAPVIIAPLVKSGKLRALAVTSSQRFEGMPDAPTTAEAGMPGFLLLNSYGLLGPKGVPERDVTRISAALKQASESPDVRQQLLDRGVSPAWASPETFAREAMEDFTNNGHILQKAGVKPE